YEGGIIGFSFADRDLFGYGRPLITSIEISERGYKGEILWDDPHFLESDVELKIRLSALTFDFDGYSKFEIGDRIEFSHSFTKQYKVGLFASQRHVEIISADIHDDLLGNKRYFVSSMGLFHTLDLRDSPVVPSRGFVFGQTFELAASGIGSEIEFFRTTARASYFIPFGKTLLEFGARAGVIRPLNESASDITAIPIDERFFNGGSTTVRSFGERELGPHDRHGFPIGGEFYTIFNVEYTFPLYGELQGAVYVDAGNLLPDADNPGFNDMRYGIGAGLRYKLPIGPIRLLIFVIPSEVEESLATFQEDREGGSKRCLGFARHDKRTAVKKDLRDTPPEIFREQLHRLADWIADFRGKMETLRVAPDSKPGAIRAALPAQPPEQGEPFEKILADVDRVILPGMVHWSHPMFLAYFG